nr:gustatory receptor 2 [Matsumurasca onukii]
MNIIIFIYWSISGVKDIATCVLAVVNCLQVIIVNCVTQFSVSSIYEESKRCLPVFSLVPSTSYCKEVKRLYEQVSADTLALTGCQFFHVTRSVILTMVSTIVTYEVVLIQFGDYTPEESTNSTKPLCPFEIPPPYNSLV